MCFRIGEYFKVNINMFLESFYNQLKIVYFEGKRNRRIDIFFEILLQIENNLYFKYLVVSKFSIFLDENIQIVDRYKSSFEILDFLVF